MKIVHMIADLDNAKGGPVSAVTGLARAQISAGHDVHVVATDSGWRGGPGDIPLTLFRSWDRAWRFSPGLATGVHAIVRGCDVVHLHGLWDFPILAGARASRKARKRYVVTLHGMLNTRALASRPWRKRAYLAFAGGAILRHASRLHFTSEMEHRNAAAAGYEGRAFVCPFGTMLPALDEDGPAFRARLGLAAKDRIVLFVGRLHPQKRPELLVRAFEEVVLHFPRACLVLVGDGDAGHVSRLHSIAARSAKRIVFAGALAASALAQAYAACDVLVLPSTEESQGLAALEAMAAARPVIVTPEVGLAPLVAACDAGRVVEAHPSALALAICEVLSDAGLRRRMGANARALVQSRFSWEVVVRSIEREYDRLPGASREH